MNAPSFGIETANIVGEAVAKLHQLARADGDGTPQLPEIPYARQADKHIRRLSDLFPMSHGEKLALALCYAAQVSPPTARLIARLQAPVGGSQPVSGFLVTLFGESGLDILTLCAGPLAEAGLLALAEDKSALAERMMQMPANVAAALGEHMLYPDAMHAPESQHVNLASAVKDEIAIRAKAMEQGFDDRQPHILLLRCHDRRDGISAACQIAEILERRPVVAAGGLEGRHAGWLHIVRALYVLESQAGPGEHIELRLPSGYDAPVILIAGNEGSFCAPVPVHEWRIPAPTLKEREQLWRSAGFGKKAAAEAARRYRHGAARIQELAGSIEGGNERGRGKTQMDRLGQALLLGSSPLDKLARRSVIPVARGDIVLPQQLEMAVERLRGRIAQRNLLADRLGPTLQARYRPGVRALFTGDSGTGKTLAAHWLSQEAGLPLYRVDLSALTSKWIGETEKNLSALLDLAEHADVMLFFDEADSLFGARTDVGDSNDRFANAQTNFLLQRIEEFDGVALLATNSRDRFDPAFVRRLDAILEFPLPDAAARLKIWKAHLGEAHQLDETQLGRLATDVDLAGGHVRNIVLSATSIAMGMGRGVCARDLVLAASEEYLKLGRAPPALLEC